MYREPGPWVAQFEGTALRVTNTFGVPSDNPNYSSTQPNFTEQKVQRA